MRRGERERGREREGEREREREREKTVQRYTGERRKGCSSPEAGEIRTLVQCHNRFEDGVHVTVVGCTQTVLWQADKWKLFRRRTQGEAGRQLRLIWCWPYLCWLHPGTDRKESTVWTQSPYCSAIWVSLKTWLFTLKFNFILNGFHKAGAFTPPEIHCTISVHTPTCAPLETSRNSVLADFKWLLYSFLRRTVSEYYVYYIYPNIQKHSHKQHKTGSVRLLQSKMPLFAFSPQHFSQLFALCTQVKYEPQ